MHTISDLSGAGMARRDDFLAGARDASGMFFGAAMFGLLFGSAATAAGLDILQAMSMSALIFAGTAQFATLALWGEQLPLAAMAISAAMVTSRLALMGLSLAPSVREMPWPLRPVAAFLINDPAWALTLQGRYQSSRAAYFFGVSAPMYAIWVGASAVGVIVAGLVDPVTSQALAFAGLVFLANLIGVVVRGVDAPRAPLVVAAAIGIALDGVIDQGASVLVAVAGGAITAMATEVARSLRNA